MIHPLNTQQLRNSINHLPEGQIPTIYWYESVFDFYAKVSIL